MKRKGFKSLLFGALYLIVFVVWTLLIQIVDVQPVGQNGTDIGFATINCYFHKLTGVHMVIYTITDWLGLVPIFICLIFEMIPINYRPVLIDGFMEASYPSSTTLLVLSVMPTLCFQAKRRMKNEVVLKYVCVFSALFSIFMFVGRTVAGVHWLTDIMGSILLSTGLFLLYRAIVLLIDEKAKA